MPLSKEERIATIGLLIKREAEYARVDGIEVKTNQFYKATAPNAIPPSHMKRKAPKTSKAKKAPAPKSIKLRRLKDDECAYRYVWLERGAEQIVTTIDAR